MDKHLLIVWDADVEAEFGNDLFEQLTENTIPYLINNGIDPRWPTGWPAHPDKVAQTIAESIKGFSDFLTSSVSPANIKVIVCAKADGLQLLINSKMPIVFYPTGTMTMEEIEGWLIRCWLLNDFDRLDRELETVLARLHRGERVKTLRDVNALRRHAAEFFDHTQIRWGHYCDHSASMEGGASCI
jgi:hypothetical protein